MAAVHLICKRRARNENLTPENIYSNIENQNDAEYASNLFRDTENFYRFREICKSGNRLLKKNFKACKPTGDTMCSICCDDMTVAT